MIKIERDIVPRDLRMNYSIQRFCVGVCVGGCPPATVGIPKLARLLNILQNYIKLYKYFAANILQKNTTKIFFGLNCVGLKTIVCYLRNMILRNMMLPISK